MALLYYHRKTKQQDSQQEKNDSQNQSTNPNIQDSSNSPYADSSSVSSDERPYYQPDSYYTFYSYPGSIMSQKVIPFDERKKISFPSTRGLYVAEIMLLEYCRYGKYPKPESGYPGFWWFKYGIRDVGHALEALEIRGFLRWTSKTKSLNNLKIKQLKDILTKKKLSTTGNKPDLINRIIDNIPEQNLIIPNYTPKYELTDLGKEELIDNGYIPYMHKHRHATTEDNRFGETFTVWDINKLFSDGDARNWRQIVGNIEKKRFGVNMANAKTDERQKDCNKQIDVSYQRDEIQKYLASRQKEISDGIKTEGDGFAEESKGLDYKEIGNDKEALVMFYISIGKHFDAPALYRETSLILRKYGMFKEELSVIEAGLKNIPLDNRYRNELFEQKEIVQELIKRQNDHTT